MSSKYQKKTRARYASGRRGDAVAREDYRAGRVGYRWPGRRTAPPPLGVRQKRSVRVALAVEFCCLPVKVKARASTSPNFLMPESLS